MCGHYMWDMVSVWSLYVGHGEYVWSLYVGHGEYVFTKCVTW